MTAIPEKYLNTLTVRVEVDAGVEVTEAAHQLCELANRIGCDVRAEFNGIICIAQPGGKATDLLSEWWKAMGEKKQFKFAFARRAPSPAHKNT